MLINPLQTRFGLFALATTLLVCFAFARLGMWQLSRAAEKVSMMEKASDAAAQVVSADLGSIDFERDLYRRYHLSGQFLPERQFLLDNRIRGGRAGFEVVSLFQRTGDGGYVLVNRGWVAAGASRQQLPSIALTGDPVVGLQARLVRPSQGFALGPAIEIEHRDWPRLLQYIDYDAIASALGLALEFDAVFVAEPEQPQVLQYNFQPVANGPEKHYAYAFQWFAMLVAMLTIYLYLTFAKRND